MTHPLSKIDRLNYVIRDLFLSDLIGEMLQLRNDRSGRRHDGIAIAIARMQGAIASCRLQIGRDLRIVYDAETSSCRADELKIVTGFLQRPVHFQLRYVALLSSAFKFDRAIPKACYC